MKEKPYGSGYFGEWFEDEFGLPAYCYTCDQINDPRAITPVYSTWRSPTDHSHQIGNDRLVGMASNYGYIQVRQDEGSPKFLNDYNPKHDQYGGGFGYLTDEQVILSTFYPGHGEAFERIFGIGYFRKKVTGNRYSIDQVIFAPFGDDPLLISQVTIKNNQDVSVNLRWIEYWGCQAYQFSYRASMLAFLKRDLRVAAKYRRQLAERFSHRFRKVKNGIGLMEEKKFLGRSLADKVRWAILQVILATVGKKFVGGPVKPPVKQASLEDLSPPATFLISLDAPADGIATDARSFFGKGGVDHPDGIKDPLAEHLSSIGSESALLLERQCSLESGESKTLYFAFGYLPDGLEFDSLLDKYRTNLTQLWPKSCAAWKEDRIQLTIPGEQWVDRELIWHNYYVRSNLTYDSFFKEHILSQGHVYQYIIGFQGAARDDLQHALPFIFSKPEIVKEVLRYTLKEVSSEGKIPYGIVGNGIIMPAPFRPSDLELWLLWLASEYVLATRDTEFLDERIPTYPIYGSKPRQERIRDLLMRCYHHIVEVLGTGEHGLLRLSNCDWNDGIIVGHVPAEQQEQVEKYGESVLNAAMAAYVLDLYGGMLTYIGDTDAASDVHGKAEAQRQAVRAQWTDRWFRRAWLTPDLGWIGEEQLWLEPQPWAIISGAATPQQTETLVQAIEELVRCPSAIGAMLLSKGVANMEIGIGILTNGGVWPSINGTLIWALAMVNGSFAWDEWKKNTLAQHAEAYPTIWYGIWSGPDSYNSALSRYPGQTMFDESLLPNSTTKKPTSSLFAGVNWTDCPVMNMHPHAWPLYSTSKLIGVEFTSEGVKLTPCLPKREYRFASPLLGLEKSAKGYSGWYAPTVAAKWQITLHLPEKERDKFSKLEINGKERPLTRAANGDFILIGKSTTDKPLRWTLK